jgi:effector-binding domain-containing protein
MGDDGITIETVTPLPLAAVRRQVTIANAREEMVKAPVWALIEERGLKSLGQTVVVYHDRGNEMLLAKPGGVAADIGVLLQEPFAGDSLLQCVMTPAGRAAHARHYGHYEMLSVIHGDIRAWCMSEGLSIAGINWEHYAHWHEEPAERVTDLYYLLR